MSTCMKIKIVLGPKSNLPRSYQLPQFDHNYLMSRRLLSLKQLLVSPEMQNRGTNSFFCAIVVHDFKFHFHNFHVEHDHVEVCHLKVSRKLLVNPSICNSASALVYILKAVAYSCLDASAALSMKNVEASQTFHLARAVSCRTWFQRSVLGSRCFT